MKPTNPESARLQKWGLFVLLAGSLGFSLSMNPDHFNNIARNEGPMRMFEFAQEAVPTTPAKSATAAPGEEEALNARVFKRLMIGKDICRVTVTMNEDKKLTGDVHRETEAQPCRWADQNQKIQLSTNDIRDGATLVQEIVAKLTAAETTATDDPKKSTKPGSATEVDLAKWAEKCDNKKDTALLTCHKNQLIALSKFVKNDTEGEDLVTEYFSTHLESEIKNGLHGTTIKEMSAEECLGTQVYPLDFGRVGCKDSDSLEQAQDLSEEITKGLRAGNGKTVVQRLIKLRAGSFSAQLRNSQALAIRGHDEQNIRKQLAGLNGLGINPMNPYMSPMTNQFNLLNDANSSLLDAIQGMQGTATQRSALVTSLDRMMYSPVSGLLNSLRQAAMMNNQTNGSLDTLLNTQIPSLGGDSTLSYDNLNTNRLAGMPESLIFGRGSRGSGLQHIGLPIQGLNSSNSVNSFDYLLNGNRPVGNSQRQGRVGRGY